MRILNLGCGNKTSDKPGVVNVDWSIYLRLKRSEVLRRIAPLVIGAERSARFRALPDNVLVHDLKRGIPFADGSVDAVYHSHMLEHIDRDLVGGFLEEVRRVLRPGGVHRVVVPDLEALSRLYLEHLAIADANEGEGARHDEYVAAIIEQSVRREASGTSQQPPLRRFVENVLLGDARKRGETHQWMYDRVNLSLLLREAGFREVHVQSFETSLIAEWPSYGLDSDASGAQYKRHSLYLEAVK